MERKVQRVHSARLGFWGLKSSLKENRSFRKCEKVNRNSWLSGRDRLATSIFQVLIKALKGATGLEGCGPTQPCGVPEIPLIEEGISMGIKAQSDFSGCEGPQPSRPNSMHS